MTVRVQYFGQLRTVSGVGEETIDVAGRRSLLDVLRALPGPARPQLSSFLFDADGAFAASLLVMLNSQPVTRAELPATTVGPGDEVALVPPIAGG